MMLTLLQCSGSGDGAAAVWCRPGRERSGW